MVSRPVGRGLFPGGYADGIGLDPLAYRVRAVIGSGVTSSSKVVTDWLKAAELTAIFHARSRPD